MSESVVISIIGLVGAVLGAAIGTFGTIEAAKIRIKVTDQEAKFNGVSRTIVGVMALVATVVFGKLKVDHLAV